MIADEKSTEALRSARLRTGVIEAMEVLSSLEKQLEYEHRVPVADVPAEVIIDWEAEFVAFCAMEWEPGTFTDEEIAAIWSFDAVVQDVCDATPDDLGCVADVSGTPAWQRLMAAAAEALAVMMRRGMIPEGVQADVNC